MQRGEEKAHRKTEEGGPGPQTGVETTRYVTAAMDVCGHSARIGLSYHIHLHVRCPDMFAPISVRAKIQTTRQQNVADNARGRRYQSTVDH